MVAGWSSDEFCDFETLPYDSFGGGSDAWFSDKKLPEANNFVRWALTEGLKQEQTLGVNGLKFGMIGSTDTHIASPGLTQEDAAHPGQHHRSPAHPKTKRAGRHEASGEEVLIETRIPEGWGDRRLDLEVTIPPELAAIVQSCLLKDPSKRPTALELEQRFAAHLEGARERRAAVAA